MATECPIIRYGVGDIPMGDNEAALLVKERFELAEQLAIDQVDLAQTYLTALSTLFADAVMPEFDIPYNFKDITLDSDFPSPPERPAPPSIDVPPDPVLGSLHTISIPTITIPTYDLVEPDTVEILFNEPVYYSALQDVLKPALIAFVRDGGTGLGSDVEDALWERGRNKQAILNERVYDEASEFFASKNYTIPPGALGGRLTEALAEQTRADAQLNFEILIEQARLARAQSEYTMGTALTLEGQDKEQFNNVANRALDYAKAAAQVIIDFYTAKVQAFVAKYQGIKLMVEAEKLKVDAVTAANKGIVDIYVAEIEGFKSKLQAEVAIIEAIAKIYGYQIAGYKAEAEVAAMDLDAQIKVYQAKIDQASNQTTLVLKEAEMLIQAFLGALHLTSDAIKASGNISAQIAASALSAVNASANLGDRTTRTAHKSSNKHTSNSCSEVHRYDHTTE